MSHRGYWIRLTLDNGLYNEIVGISSYAEALYLLKRRYAYTPNIKHVGLFIGSKLIEEKEIKDMTSFTQFAKENPSVGSRSFASSSDKETLVAFAIPFTIVAAIEVLSSFKDEKTGDDLYSINYDIDIDIKSAAFQYAQKVKEVKSGYRLSLPSNGFRRKQLTDLIQPTFAEGGMRAVLSKQGKGYVFTDAPVPADLP